MGAPLALLLGGVAAAGAAEQIGPGAIAASIHDHQGHPISGATVLATGPVERTATTGAAGIVTMSALPLGTYTLRATRSGFEPIVATVVVAAGPSALRFTQLELALASFSNLHGATDVSNVGGLSATGDPVVAHALTAMPDVDVVPAGVGPAAAGVSALDTLPSESREELDGIPIAGGPYARNAVWFRDALVLDDIEVATGPVVHDSSLQDAIGGVINYQTLPISSTPQYDLAAGYDSEFGSFQRVRFSDTLGRLGFALDTVGGGGLNRSQVVKLNYALSPATSLGFSSYGSQSTTSLDGADVTSNAPAFALDLRSQLGTSSLQVRSWRSSAMTQESIGSFAWPLESDRQSGTQISLDVPAGNQLLSFSFDRRSDLAMVDGVDVDSTFTTALARGDFQLSRDARLELGEVLSGGTLLPQRTDPQAGFSYRVGDRLMLSASAGSAYATAPDSVLAALPADVHALVPETTFGWRVSAERELAAGDHLSLSAFDIARYDIFANLADARTQGLQLGFNHDPGVGRLAIAGFVGLASSDAFGPVQPQYRFAGTTQLIDGTQLPGDPYSKARLALSYRSRSGTELRFGATLLGAGNAFGTGAAVALADASVQVPLFQAFDVRLAASNFFGYPVAQPLAPLYSPHELSLSLVRH